ncbi:hypothetical protein HK100_008669 [Physocladia obscura]|uniref:Uncharacterized protein n=1 Tax=Physocladia obscura TaxID=109957 RepID=A0AAD5SN85_9FUNG|nr:hypothetical protein HK100_008669 [Physocladia obscura]
MNHISLTRRKRDTKQRDEQTSMRRFSVTTGMRKGGLKEDRWIDLYLAAIRNYKAPKDAGAASAASLVSAFATPTPPAPPQLELAEAEAAVDSEAAVTEAEWPALKNIIDDHHNYPDEWDFYTSATDGVLLPKRLKPVDYTGGDH